MPQIATLIGLTSLALGNGNVLSFHLSAHVPVQCAITDIEVRDQAAGLVRIHASCNAATFRVKVGGDLSLRAIKRVSVADATAGVVGSGVVVRPRLPGQYVLDLDYGTDIRSVRSVDAMIQAN